jgi:hypothetical protein
MVDTVYFLPLNYSHWPPMTIITNKLCYSWRPTNTLKHSVARVYCVFWMGILWSWNNNCEISYLYRNILLTNWFKANVKLSQGLECDWNLLFQPYPAFLVYTVKPSNFVILLSENSFFRQTFFRLPHNFFWYWSLYRQGQWILLRQLWP